LLLAGVLAVINTFCARSAGRIVPVEHHHVGIASVFALC
jgi:hypothetical protein